MRNFTGKFIILGHKNLSEADRLIYLYNEELGKIKVIAKGARKITSKFTGHLETLNICTASIYFGPRNTILTEIISNESFRKNPSRLEKLSSALQIAEITNDVLYENQILDDLTRLIEKTIKHLSTTKKPSLISMAYIIKLLDKVGIIPDFKTTEISLEHKYVKFFQYLKTEPLSKIEKIRPTEEEALHITNFLKKLIEEETSTPFKSFSI